MRSGIVALLLFAVAAAAHADRLTIHVVESRGGWLDAVALLRERGDSVRALHVQAIDERGEVVACRDYRLALDAHAKKAFSVGDCDRVSNATELRFAGRHLLFVRADGIGQPIMPSVVAVRPPAPPLPPPAPLPPPPPPPTTCWALVGPQVVDPESGKRKTVSPSRVALDFASTITPPQTVAFDQAWLVRVPKADGLTEIGYALVPWYWRPTYSKTAPSMQLQKPAGLLHLPLQLRCDGDPLGNQDPTSRHFTVVPDRVATVDPFGASLTLRRARSDGALFAQQLAGIGMIPIGATALFVGLITTPGWDTSRRGQALGGSLLGVGAGLVAGGLVMYYRAVGDQILRYGTHTVSVDPAHLAVHF